MASYIQSRYYFASLDDFLVLESNYYTERYLKFIQVYLTYCTL